MKFFLQLTAIFLTFFSLTNNAFADRSPVHSFSEQAKEYMINMNAQTRAKEELSNNNPNSQEGLVLPYGEYEKQGFLIFNDELNIEFFDEDDNYYTFSAFDAKRGFLENLPDSITPVVYTQNESPEYIQSLKETFGAFLKDPSKLKIMYLNTEGNGFWARDGIPVPMYYRNNNQDHFLVVDAAYYHDFEPDQLVANRFGALTWSHNYYFEGGNFVANAAGDCLIVNTERVQEIPNSVFQIQYGCRQIIKLPYIRGIGHADESVKFVSDDIVLTDLPQYKRILEARGFSVVMVPQARRRFETYLNSVILNKTVFVPAYGYDSDLDALNVYRSLGYKAIPLDSYSLSNVGAGSLHCISMVYPNDISYEDFLKNTGGEKIDF